METMTDTPETDGIVEQCYRQINVPTNPIPADFARKLERERDKAQEALKTGGLLDIIDRAGHDRAEAIRERDEARKWSATLADAGDEIRAQLREEQQLHVQTLNERDEARERADTMFAKYVDILEQTRNERDEARVQLAGIENKMRGELGGHPESELWGDAGLIAATMRCVDAIGEVTDQRDEWKAKYIQQNKDLGCEMMDPNGTIWDYAKKVQTEIAKLRSALIRINDAVVARMSADEPTGDERLELLRASKYAREVLQHNAQIP